MIVYRVIDGQSTIDFSTQLDADSFIASQGLNTTPEIVTIATPAAASLLSNLEDSAPSYIAFGTDLWEELKKKTWAYNTYLKITGSPLTTTQMQTLLTTTDMINKCLTTGSLLTAKDVLNALKAALPQYSTIADYAVTKINTFLGV